jgi:di/tricarboxylate transporter
MSVDQALAFAILLGTIAAFVWGGLPYDLVALLALFTGIVTGVVPPAKAFEGFSDEIVIIIAAALLVSAAVARSGAVETLMRRLLPRLRTVRTQVPALVGAVTLLSIFTKNVGALAIFMPVALQVARRTGTPPSRLLMPMSFGSLLGGLVTLIGTSPNIIIARVRADALGKPFGMFAYTPVGLGIAIVGVAFLCFGYRLLPSGRKAAASMEAAFTMEDYTAEARLTPQSPATGRTVAELEALGDGEVAVTAVIRERSHRYVPTPEWRLREDDVVLLEGEPEDLERLVARARLNLARGEENTASGGVSVVEGVVTVNSPLAGRTPVQLDLQRRHQLTLLAVSRSGEKITQRLGTVRLRAGDVVVLRGASDALPERLGELRILPLAERSLALGRNQRGWLPVLVLAAAMACVAFRLAPVAVAFFGAAVVLLLLGVITMAEAYESMEWHVLILLGALIPLSHAVRDTGGTALIAGWLTSLVQLVPPIVALTVILVGTMAVTPFLHNAPTVLVVGPIAASLAIKLHLNPDPFLMAVALGAGCDFLTPIGHQCNTLVMGPGGYRFGDYSRLGLPLSLLVVAVGVPLIRLVWPLHGH